MQVSKLEKEVATLMQQTETEEMVVRKQRRTKEQQEAYEQARCVRECRGCRQILWSSQHVICRIGRGASTEEAVGSGRVSCACRVASTRSF